MIISLFSCQLPQGAGSRPAITECGKSKEDRRREACEREYACSHAEKRGTGSEYQKPAIIQF